jgi:hypothetical protein
MKVCVISNSHAASLKAGYETIKDCFPGIEVSFFASPAASLSSLQKKEGVICSQDLKVSKILSHCSGGSDHIRIGDYDRFLVYGLDFNISADAGLVSKAVFAALFQDHTQQQLNHKICQLLLPEAHERIWVGPCPLPAALPDQTDQGHRSNYSRAIDNYRRVLAAFGLTLLAQPSETVVDGAFTAKIYSDGSLRLGLGVLDGNLEHSSRDRVHMNTAFGALYMRNFLKNLENCAGQQALFP